MLKSNNHCCQPEDFGRKKGDHSPFFHILNSEEFHKILANKGLSLSFIAEMSENDLSMIFPKEKRLRFWEYADTQKQNRLEFAKKIRECADSLAEILTSYDSLLTTNLSITHAASFALGAEKILFEIRNIFQECTEISKNLSHISNSYFHIQKLLLLWECFAEYDTDTPSPETSSFSECSPENLIDALERFTKLTLAADNILQDGTLCTARAAKQNNQTAYRRETDRIALALHDIIGQLKNHRKEV